MDFETAMWLSCNKSSQHSHYSPKDFDLGQTSNPADSQDTTLAFRPKFDSQGLITAVVADASSKDILMVAFMNQEALDATQETGIAHFYSRSRQSLWMKGETSGNRLSVREIWVDCDQDALILSVVPNGPACHTGQKSCFYRKLDGHSLVKVKA